MPSDSERPETPAVRCDDWLAMYDVHHSTDFWPCDSREEAEAHIKAGEDDGKCYGVAIYQISTDTLHMHDTLKMCDPEKVRAGIKAYLANGKVELPR